MGRSAGSEFREEADQKQRKGREPEVRICYIIFIDTGKPRSSVKEGG